MFNARSLVSSLASAAALALASLAATPVHAQEKITYLLPAPFVLPSFAPYVIARERGFYKEENLEINFEVGKGGIDVAKQVGAGTVDIGHGPGDGSIVVRPNGVPIKIVAMLGGGSLGALIVNGNSTVKSPSDLKGKTVTVMSYQDGTFYTLLGMLGAVGLTRNDVDIQAVGPTNVWQLLLAGKSEAMLGVPDWIGAMSDNGGSPRVVPTDQYFVGLPQTIIASDRAIREKPELIRRFVRATLRGLNEIVRDPDAAAKVYLKAMPQYAGKEASITRVINLYAQRVFKSDKPIGTIDVARLEKTQDFYAQHAIIQSKSPMTDLYATGFLPTR